MQNLDEETIATLENIIAIVYVEFPETRGLFQTLLGSDEYPALLGRSQARQLKLERAHTIIKDIAEEFSE